MADDNFVATVKYENGSLAVLTYVALGNNFLPKERIEIFSGGSSIIIDDFDRMELYGFSEKHVNLKKKDKGHYNQLVEFSNMVKGRSSSCLTFSEAVKATDITLKVVDIISKLDYDQN